MKFLQKKKRHEGDASKGIKSTRRLILAFLGHSISCAKTNQNNYTAAQRGGLARALVVGRENWGSTQTIAAHHGRIALLRGCLALAKETAAVGKRCHAQSEDDG